MEDIFEDFRRLEEEMNKMFEEIWGTPLRGRGRNLLLPGESTPSAIQRYGRQRRPFLDLFETDKDIVATADLPGINKEDIKINITGDRLEISGESKVEEEKKEKGYVYRERRSGGFYRSINLPSEVDPDNVKASYNNGVLSIQMPKIEIQEKKSIKID